MDQGMVLGGSRGSHGVSWRAVSARVLVKNGMIVQFTEDALDEEAHH